MIAADEARERYLARQYRFFRHEELHEIIAPGNS